MKPFILALVFALPAASAMAIDASVQLTLPGDSQQTTARYECEGDDPITVRYINADPNFLAIVPVNGADLLFVNVLSGSGARYASGPYVWWSSGAEASLYDETAGEDAPALLTCIEFTDIP